MYLSTLNLLSLAKSGTGHAKPVPDTGLEVQALGKPVKETLARDLWLLVLQGELLVDLPHGDFRHLKLGDSLKLSAETALTFTPVSDTVILRGP